MDRKQPLLSSEVTGFTAEVHNLIPIYGIPDGVSNSSRPKFLLCRHTSILNKKSDNYTYLHTAWRKAKERDTWHQVVSTATLC